MTYIAKELSVSDGRPIELYDFVLGTTHYRYTSAEHTVNAVLPAGAGTFDFEPLENLGRNDPELSKELNQGKLEVTMMRDAPIALLFKAFVPSVELELNIYRKHDNDTQVVSFWNGQVKDCRWSGPEATLTCETNLGKSRRRGLRQTFGPTCQWALYGSGCGINKELYRTNAVVTATTGATFTAAAIASPVAPAGIVTSSPKWFVAGLAIRANGEMRSIVAQTSTSVTLMLPFANLVVGETIALYAGCDHSLTACNTKFQNVFNARLFNITPTKNPFTHGLK